MSPCLARPEYRVKAPQVVGGLSGMAPPRSTLSDQLTGDAHTDDKFERTRLAESPRASGRLDHRSASLLVGIWRVEALVDIVGSARG